MIKNRSRKKLAHPLHRTSIKCNAGGRSLNAYVNGNGVRKVVESVVGSVGARGDDAWGWYVRIHARDRRYSFYLVYHEFYVRPSEHLFV